MMASADNSHYSKRITEARFDVVRTDRGDCLHVLVTLEDGSERQLLDVPVGDVRLERRNLVDRTFASAYRQAMCWLEAAHDGIHRIIAVEKIGPIDEVDPERRELNGTDEVRVRMSDGTSVRAFVFYADEISFREDEFLDLSLEQAHRLRSARDAEDWEFMTPDYSWRGNCLCCSRRH